MHTPLSETKSLRSSMPGARELVAMMASLMALNALAIDTMLPAFQNMRDDLGLTDPNHIQLIISIYLLAMGLGSIVYGPLSDRFGRKAILLPAIGGYGLFSLACSFAPSFDVLLVMRFAQGLCGAALGVLVAAVIRDRFEGDKMARHMSMIFMTFMIVPIIAPSIGALILKIAPWRTIFDLFALLALAVAIWVWRRLPETLDPENILPMQLSTMASGSRAVLTNRVAIGYVFASAVIQGSLYGYLNASEQLFAVTFNARDFFPIGFAIIAIGIAMANFTNSRIVERFGARRVSHCAVFLFISFSVMQLVAAISMPHSLMLFILLLMPNMALIGFLGSNFSSIAMQPFGHMAGIASSFQQFLRQMFGAIIGGVIGAQFDGSVVPIAIGFCICGVISLLVVFWCESGKLFTRPNAPKQG
jgi:MFS transporter, DHA1 family, multidrug resistance protein